MNEKKAQQGTRRSMARYSSLSKQAMLRIKPANIQQAYEGFSIAVRIK